MAAQNNQAHLLANYSSHATNLISERLKANNRFSPYPVSSITGPIASTLGSASPTGIASAFKSLGGVPGIQLPIKSVSPPVSPPHSASPPRYFPPIFLELKYFFGNQLIILSCTGGYVELINLRLLFCELSAQMLFRVGCKVRTVQQGSKQAAGEKILLFDLPIGKSPTCSTNI